MRVHVQATRSGQAGICRCAELVEVLRRPGARCCSLGASCLYVSGLSDLIICAVGLIS